MDYSIFFFSRLRCIPLAFAWALLLHFLHLLNYSLGFQRVQKCSLLVCTCMCVLCVECRSIQIAFTYIFVLIHSEYRTRPEWIMNIFLFGYSRRIECDGQWMQLIGKMLFILDKKKCLARIAISTNEADAVIDARANNAENPFPQLKRYNFITYGLFFHSFFLLRRLTPYLRTNGKHHRHATIHLYPLNNLIIICWLFSALSLSLLSSSSSFSFIFISRPCSLQ